MHKRIPLLCSALFALILAFTASALALDPKFQDANGDLVADAPADPAQFIDPPVLIFAYTPVEDPAVYAKVWDGFLKHMEKLTGKKVIFFPVQSNAAQIEAMRAGRLHVAGFNTGGTPLGVNCAGYVPFAMMAGDNNAFGYEMEIITHPASGITKIEDIKGKKLAFTSETSNSGYKAPSALLSKQFNLIASRDFTPVFSGKHDNSILGVANKDYDAAAIANEVMKRMMDRGVVKKEQIVTIYKSQTFPTTSYGYVYNLKPELVAKIKDSFLSFPWAGTELAKEFSQQGVTKFMEINYKTHWDIVRQIDTAMNVSYTCK